MIYIWWIEWIYAFQNIVPHVWICAWASISSKLHHLHPILLEDQEFVESSKRLAGKVLSNLFQSRSIFILVSFHIHPRPKFRIWQALVVNIFIIYTCCCLRKNLTHVWIISQTNELRANKLWKKIITDAFTAGRVLPIKCFVPDLFVRYERDAPG